MAQKKNQSNDPDFNNESVVTVNFRLSRTIVSFGLGAGLTFGCGTVFVNKQIQSQNQYISCPTQKSIPLNKQESSGENISMRNSPRMI